MRYFGAHRVRSCPCAVCVADRWMTRFGAVVAVVAIYVLLTFVLAVGPAR